MDRGVKFALASAVLLLGATVALLYRHPSTPTAKPTSSARPVLRESTRPNPPPSPPEQPRPQVTRALATPHPRVTIRASLDKDDPPPELARVYPRPDDWRSSQPVEFPGYQLPRPADDKPALRIHKVADGDTLTGLADRYLGSADRAMEIFELNREVLATPGPLRIGIELRIPLQTARPAEDHATLSEPPLVPVRL
ncbi:MAG: hypothetical protein JW888_05770 [Pirellulales bacterium]|nr:hypothetical protein [Pirellulales bacterium]